MNRIDLEGRHAVVTGGAKGIGLAIARRFVESGATVTIWDIDRSRSESALAALNAPARVRADAVDITDPEAIGAGLSHAISETGPVAIFVNNAGAVGALAPVWEQPVENWTRMLTLNLTGAFLCCRAVVPHMREQGYGRVINIASAAGKMAVPNNAPYAAAKAGLISLTKTLAREVAKTGILVNAVAPGGANTELFDALSEDYRAAIAGTMALGRLVEPEEVAAITAWLASEDCSFSTGAVFDVSGGRLDY